MTAHPATAETIALWLLGLRIGDGSPWDLWLDAIVRDIRAGVPWKAPGEG